jgi:hypothetical protein
MKSLVDDEFICNFSHWMIKKMLNILTMIEYLFRGYANNVALKRGYRMIKSNYI